MWKSSYCSESDQTILLDQEWMQDMYFKKVVVVGGIGLLLLFASCQQSPIHQSGGTDDTPVHSEQLVLGKRLENPYSVTSMFRARDSLISSGALSKTAIGDEELVATHYYVRFKPQTDAELIALESCSSLVLWDYPLDYEILEGGTVYRDPEVPLGAPNYQYTTVLVNHSLPPIEYEILEELILEPELSDSLLLKMSMSNIYSQLEQEALRITGNQPRNVTGLSKAMGTWRPSGNIQVSDDILIRNVPIISVNVRTRNWFKWWDGYTDGNGNFHCPKDYYGDISYSLRWQYPDNRFDIRDDKVGQAFYNGPSQSSRAWNLVISSGTSWVYAHIFRGGSFYLCQEPFGLNDRPFDLISIQAMNERCPVDKDAYYRSTNENIRIWRYRNDGTVNSAINLFANTAHELGHAEHDEIYDGSFLINIEDRKLKESWAVAVEFYLTSTVYGSSAWTIIPGSDFDVGRQCWVGGDYTPLMVDLIDGHNQRVDRQKPNYLDDPVSGYTLKQFETIIAKNACKKVSDFVNEVKNLSLPAGMTATIRDSYLNQF